MNFTLEKRNLDVISILVDIKLTRTLSSVIICSGGVRLIEKCIFLNSNSLLKRVFSFLEPAN